MISLLCPSRGRPKQFDRMVESALSNASGTVEIVVRLDQDDPTVSDYREAISAYPGLRYCRLVGPRIPLSHAWNNCWSASTGDIYMMAADDVVFHTPGWNAVVEKAFAQVPDRIMFVYGHDHVKYMHPIYYGTHGFIHRRWTETVGYFVPPYFEVDYVDSWLNNVAHAIGRHLYVPIVTEHVHYSHNKTVYDQTYADAASKRARAAQEWTFRQPELATDVAKLQNVLDKSYSLPVRYTF